MAVGERGRDIRGRLKMRGRGYQRWGRWRMGEGYLGD